MLEPGYKYNMTDIAAVLGLGQLARVDVFNQKRRTGLTTGRDWRRSMRSCPFQPSYPMKHAWHLFIVRLDTDKAGLSREEFMARLKQRNIGTGLHFLAVHLQKYYREKMGMRRGLLPNTEWNSERICSLPLFPEMTPDDVDDVVEAIKKVLSNDEPLRTGPLSIVIPVYNEEPNLPELVGRCLRMRGNGKAL